MNWKEYEKLVIKEAMFQNKGEDYISRYLSYAKVLFDQKLPIIADINHFSKLVGLNYEYVCSMAYSPKHFYRSFTIKKSNGKNRQIDEPLPDLKKVQRWILDEILSRLSISPYAKAFVKGRNLKHNARFHRGQNVLVTLDIKDFFPSIKIIDVYNIFIGFGYRKNIAFFLANLCCLDDILPQGAPTSPYLSNLKMRNFDKKISAFCNKNKWRYTRYADDLTFSGDINVKYLLKIVNNCVFENGFRLNSEKTRIAKKNARQEVTGIVVNHHMQIMKTDRKLIRQQIYYIKKFGLESHLDYLQEHRANYIFHLLGRINFALFINPKDASMMEYSLYLKKLYRKEFSI